MTAAPEDRFRIPVYEVARLTVLTFVNLAPLSDSKFNMDLEDASFWGTYDEKAFRDDELLEELEEYEF